MAKQRRPARPWTDDDDAILKAHHAAGMTFTAITKAMDRSRGMLSRKSEALGLDWDRTRTKAATEARVIDARARRAQLELDLLADAERLRASLWEPAVVYNIGGKDNTYTEETVPRPPAQDQLRILQATGVAIDRSLKIAAHDHTGDSELPAVDAWLNHITSAGGKS